MSDRFEKQINFILEADKSKLVQRQTYLCNGERKENDAEHAWHMALMAAVFCEYASDDIDVKKVMTMALVHDLVEIDAGDTYAYDERGNETKKAREIKAADRIFNLLPEDQAKYFRDLWDEFEEAKTNEALFTLALDKVQPILLNDASKGKSWKEHNVYLEQIIERNRLTKKGAEKLWEYCVGILEKNVSMGNILKK